VIVGVEGESDDVDQAEKKRTQCSSNPMGYQTRSLNEFET